tara:strand:- start:3287 stop:6193 length:2907 start_codon:yes stop_codon:yes gene_type:complete
MKTISYAFLILAASVFSGRLFSNTFELVSLSGETAEPTAGREFDSFSIPNINEDGQVSFGALFKISDVGETSADNSFANRGPDHLDAVLQYINGRLELIAAVGEPATISGETGVFESIRSISATGGPSIAFAGIIAPGHSLSSSEILLSARMIEDSSSPEFETIATTVGSRQSSRPVVGYDGMIAQPKRYQYFGTPQSLANHGFSFFSRLTLSNNPDDRGIWVVELPATGTGSLPVLKLAAIEGSPLNGGTATIAKPVTLAQNASLNGALLATIEDSDENDFNNDRGIWALDSNFGATLVAKSGDSAPGSSDSFLSLGEPSIDGEGNIYFWASLQNANEAEGLYQYVNGALSLLISSEQPVEIFGVNRSFSTFMDPVASDDGALAVYATESDGDLNTILARSTSGEWSIIAQSGLQAPGTALGVTFDLLSFPIINGVGQIAFQATLEGLGDSISDTTDSGAWATDENGAVVLIAREGDTFDLKPSFPATVSGAEIGGFNSNGQLAMNYAFTNGVNAIAIVGIEALLPPAISAHPSSTATYDGEPIALYVETSGQGPFTYQWMKDGEDILGATSSTLTISTATASDDGDYTVAVMSQTGSVVSDVASLSVQNLPDTPAFVDQPLGDVVLKGGVATLDSRAVSNSSIEYQWYFNGDILEGETRSVLSISPANTEDEGTYYVVATSTGGSTASENSEILVTDKRLYNIATRARVGTGANVLIAGFVIIGPDPKEILVRGIGPSLVENGINDPLLKPRLEIYNSASELIFSNEGWAENEDPDAITAASQVVGAGGRNLHDDDTALLVELEPGLYTAIVSGQDNSTGIALVEAFEIEENFTRMINLSSRALVGTGADVVIPGFVVQGDLPSRVLIRAVGPSLENQGVAGFLANPQIIVHDIAGTPIASNDGWLNLWDPSQITEASQLVGAFPLKGDSEDAAIIMDLEPGLYTVIASGENETTGVALVELYAIP